jgi:hypothetical protein
MHALCNPPKDDEPKPWRKMLENLDDLDDSDD